MSEDYENKVTCTKTEEEDFMHIADPVILREISCGSNVLTEEEYRNIVLGISEYVTDIVKKTLGPYGKTTNIDDSTIVAPTKDGWTVLRNIRFSDPLYNSIYNSLIQISFDLVTKVGDGTTTAMDAANIFMHYILHKIKCKDDVLHNMRQADLIDAINRTKDFIIAALYRSDDIHQIDMDGDFSDIYKIANIASNGNDVMAHIIQQIYIETKNPNIYVTYDPGSELSYVIQKGYKYDTKVLNQKVYRNSDDGTYKLDEPLMVAVFDHNVTYNEHRHIIECLSAYATSRNQSVLILAPYFDDIMTNIMNTLIQNCVQKNQIPNIILAQIPLATTLDRWFLSDFVMLTNAQIFDYGKVRALNVTIHNTNPANINNKIEDELLDIKQYHFDSVDECVQQCVGTINRAVIAEKYILIQGYESVYNKNIYDQTMKELENEFVEISRRVNKSSNTLTNDYLNIQQRYIKMRGNMGVIKVGAPTELQKHCLKDSVDDAVLACKSAVNSGYVRGLNFTVLEEIQTCIGIVQKTVRYFDVEMDHLNHKEDIIPEQYRTNETLEILVLFYMVYSKLTCDVIANKYPNVTDSGTGDFVVELPDGSPMLMNTSSLISKSLGLVPERPRLTFNLRTNKLETEENWSVVNSLAGDIEILNSIVSVLTVLLTSDQFISLNKQYDRNINRQMILDRKREEAKMEELGRLDAQAEFKAQEELEKIRNERIIKKIKERMVNECLTHTYDFNHNDDDYINETLTSIGIADIETE